MNIRSKGLVEHPVTSPTGEVIFELIGKTQEQQATSSHSLAQIVLPAGKLSGRHHHEHTDESIYILAGKARIEIDQEEALLTPGDSLTIPRGAVHQMFNVGQTPLEYLAICGPAWDFADQIDTVASI